MGDGVRIYASAIPLAVLAGGDIPVSIIVMSAVTLLYTWHGGLKAVVFTEVISCIILIVGAGLLFTDKGEELGHLGELSGERERLLAPRELLVERDATGDSDELAAAARGRAPARQAGQKATEE